MGGEGMGIGGYQLTITTNENNRNADAAISMWTPMKQGPTVVTGTYDGNGDPRCLLNWGVSLIGYDDGYMSEQQTMEQYMSYWNEMFGDDSSGMMDMSGFDNDTSGGLDDPGSTFLLGITKAGDEYEKPLKGYIQRITVLRWVEE